MTAPAWAQRNVICIDTGACLTEGYLSIAEIQTGELTLDRFERPGTQ